PILRRAEARHLKISSHAAINGRSSTVIRSSTDARKSRAELLRGSQNPHPLDYAQGRLHSTPSLCSVPIGSARGFGENRARPHLLNMNASRRIFELGVGTVRYGVEGSPQRWRDHCRDKAFSRCSVHGENSL